MNSLSKAETLALSRRHLIPGRLETFAAAGIDLVYGRREGYRIWDVDGAEFFDFHLNGGTYNLGHRNPELVAALVEAAETLDIGNHHFASPARAALAAELLRTSPFGAHEYVVFAAGGGEAIDVAIRSARWATGRTKIVALDSGFHGRTGLSGAVGDTTNAEYFHSSHPTQLIGVPWGDVDAIATALARDDVAAVLLETIPATAGFPRVPDGYHAAIRSLCDEHGTLLVADEVQVGLGRTGHLWAIEGHGVRPDILVTGKGLGGGLYPVSATLLSAQAGAWLQENGWGHVSTSGGAEIGCVVGLRALELSSAPATLKHVHDLSEHLGTRLNELAERSPVLHGVRQHGLVMGLEFREPDGAVAAMRAFFNHGIWAIFAAFDTSVLQFKPGLLLSIDDAEGALQRIELALAALARDALAPS
jgi:acetylornithine/succinyldiaminopimelate/putrescine aminotransferase